MTADRQASMIAAMTLVTVPALVFAMAAGGASERYLDVVEAYRAKDPDAVERLAAVPEKAIRDEIRRVQRLRQRSICLDCPERRLFAAYPVAAAAVLHTERAVRHDREGRGAEGVLHFGFARDWLHIGEPELSPALEEWYLAVGTHFLQRVELDTAEKTLSDATGRFPDAARLWVAYGITSEMRAHLTPEPDHVFSSDRKYLDERLQAAADRVAQYRTAEGRYRRAVARDPSLVAAHIRLGHILARQDRPADALRELDPAARAARDPRDVYLAHLLAGRAEEQRGRKAEAVARYRLATDAFPAGEAGWVAIAHALAGAGDRGAAQAAIARVVAADPRSELDPYRAYVHGGGGESRDLLRDLEAWVK